MRKMLTDVTYPADKKEIMEMAKKAGLGNEDMGKIKKLPDKKFSDMSEVMDEITKMESM